MESSLEIESLDTSKLLKDKNFNFRKDLYYLLNEYDSNNTNTIWHYTKMGILEKMLTSDDVKIRFMHSKFTKDPSEGLILKRIYEDKKEAILNSLNEDVRKEILKEQNKNIFDSYLFSTTYRKNCFTFWSKQYAGVDGVAIGFNKNIVEEQFSKLPSKCKEDVLYINQSDIKNNVINTIVEFLNISYKSGKENYNSLDFFWSIFPPLFKNEAWRNEKELRFILYDAENSLETKIEFCENKIIRCCDKSFNKDIISSVMLGPACNDEQQKAVEKYLKDNGYKDIKVERSHAFDLQYKE